MLVINPPNASIAASASPNARPRRSCPTPRRGSRNGSRSTPLIRPNGPTSPARRTAPPTPTSIRARKASSTNISPPSRARATELRRIAMARWRRSCSASCASSPACIFLEHGTQKFLGFPAGARCRAAASLLDNPGLMPGSSSWSCGLLIAIGLFTRPAAFLASGTMAVAYWYRRIRAARTSSRSTMMGDAAILYCFVFLYHLRRPGRARGASTRGAAGRTARRKP